MPASGIRLEMRSELLSLEALADVVAWIHESSPLRKLKLTGGEPLVRAGLPVLVSRLAALERAPELSMTTNGARLAGAAASLAAAGLARVNVSLDTLDPERYRELTRGGNLDAVLAGLEAASDAGLAPIKLNAVLRRSTWHDDVPALIDFAAERGYELRFLELMRTGTERAWCEAELIAAAEVLAWLRSHRECRLLEAWDEPELGVTEPARRGRLVWRGKELAVGWILPVSLPFCGSCDRLRLDARGRVRRCLMDPVRLPLARILRDRGPEAAARAFAAHLSAKTPPVRMDTPLPMARLGG
jgi:cyclic pyranopterin phosphate synthase